MLSVTLYIPGMPAEARLSEELGGLDAISRSADANNRIAALLGCATGMVDVLASGQGYTAYSVFDCEGEVNPKAMKAVTALSGVAFDLDNDDEVLKGPVLILEQR
ncbi:hypothetical protein [Hymenobacter cavernae]|uniref:Uncharacterized protein n=1 Tax=Hymenobacter cavernae TaxID=2044852 RepID=A0ABQ1UWX2_9BACT|nr:hypothetical protein [Hymenobacter cavernae]GGF28841.1 hypothetical protein GCM10011383_45690 [Hymenobacter cavernae]